MKWMKIKMISANIVEIEGDLDDLITLAGD
jgi:hypothetical protein